MRKTKTFTCPCGVVKLVRFYSTQKYCCQQCPSLGELRKKGASLFTPEQVLINAENLKAIRNTEEFKAAQIAGMKHSTKVGVMTAAKYASLQKALTQSRKPESRQKALKSMPSDFYKCQGKKNAVLLAKTWLLVSPKNVIFRFKNLSQFIRENVAMFDADDVIWRTPYICRATSGLSKLRPSRKKPDASWKGWRWLSIEERLKNWCGIDHNPPDSFKKFCDENAHKLP